MALVENKGFCACLLATTLARSYLIDRSLNRGFIPGIVLIDGGYGNKCRHFLFANFFRQNLEDFDDFSLSLVGLGQAAIEIGLSRC